MLNRRQLQAFRVVYTAFRYLPQFPLVWNLEYSAIHLLKSKRELFKYLLILSLITILCAASLYNVLKYLFITRQNSSYNLAVLVIHTLIIPLTGISPLLILLLYLNEEICMGFNALLKFHHENSKQSCKWNTADFFISTLAFGGAVAPLFIYVLGIGFSLDPLYYVLVDLSNYLTKRANIFVTILFLLFRLFVMLAGLEVARCLSTLAMYLVLEISTFQACLLSLCYHASNSGSKPGVIMKRYKCLRIIYSCFRQLYDAALSVVVSFVFWAVVLCCWLIIRGHRLLPKLIYCTFVVTAIMFFVGIAIFLTVTCQFSELCQRISTELGKRVGMMKNVVCVSRYFGRVEVSDTLLKRELLAQQAITLTYKPFFTVNRSFAVSFTSNVVYRVFDSIILF